MKEGVLIYVPLLVTLILVLCYSSLNSFNLAKKSFSAFDSTVCTECKSELYVNCTHTDTPVLGGVDVVNYFTAYKLADGSYNESETGVKGSSKYSTVFNGYTFYFISESNLELFEASPTSYVPQWGGFCSWGIAAEYCPIYPWSTYCMGPYGDWSHWTIQNDKLYFFWFASAKDNFMKDTTSNIAAGDLRWSGWYGDDYTTFNTNCYVD